MRNERDLEELIQYINTNGEKLPYEWEHHLQKEDYDHQCVFCKTDCPVDTCEHIEMKDGTVEGYATICGYCDEQIDILLDHTWKPSPELKTYCSTGDLRINNIHRHYTGTIETPCVFCKKDIHQSHVGLYGLNLYHNYHEYVGLCVNMCGRCNVYLDYNLNEHDTGENFEKDYCVSCSDEMVITSREYKSRSKNNLLNSHNCNTCILDDPEIKSKVAANTLIPTKIQAKCGCCKTQYIKVTSLYHGEICHYIEGYCPECIGNEEHIEVIQKIFEYDDLDYKIMLFRSDNCWSYQLSFVNDSRVLIEENNFEEIGNAVVHCKARVEKSSL